MSFIVQTEIFPKHKDTLNKKCSEIFRSIFIVKISALDLLQFIKYRGGNAADDHADYYHSGLREEGAVAEDVTDYADADADHEGYSRYLPVLGDKDHRETSEYRGDNVRGDGVKDGDYLVL